jgi:hypothetical protein
MDEPDDTKRLLTEIRDLQRESLDEYRRVTSRSLALQEQAVARQEQVSALYRRVVLGGSVLIGLLLVVLLYLVTFLR